MSIDCPNCHHQHTEVFYTLPETPVISSLVLQTKEESLKVEKKTIELSVCHECGFIFNSKYDFSVHENQEGHEDQQGFSPTFTKFINRIADQVINRYQINDKTVMEIGCGKGDFLKLMCDKGNNRGIGIDPAINHDRVPKDENLEFIKAYYSEEHANLQADLICCRHTFEHIPKTAKFMELLVKNLKGKPETQLLFEIPDVTRILDEIAFWDVYYEHCSYFSVNSLAYVFEQNNFFIEDLWLDYNGQYLMIEASSGKGKSNWFSKELVKKTIESSRKFNNKLEKRRNEWIGILQKLESEKKYVVLWGGGSKPVGFLSLFSEFDIFKNVVDINPHMDGTYVPGFGIEIISPQRLPETNPDVIIIMIVYEL